VKLSKLEDVISFGAWRYCIGAYGNCVSTCGNIQDDGVFRLFGHATLQKFYFAGNEFVIEFKPGVASVSVILKCSLEDLDDNVMAALAIEEL